MKKYNPPKWALSFLRFFYKERYLEQIEGDLYELFQRDGATRRARLRFGWNTIRFFRLRYLKGLDDFERLTTLAMIKNYLKVTLRALIRQKSYTLINISGLAVALASAMLISIYIIHERSYDDFHKNGDRMFRITKMERGGSTPPLLAHAIREEIPQFEAATRSSSISDALFKVNNEAIRQGGGIWADEHFFKVFEVDFKAGDIEFALSEPDHVVLTESIASKYFPDRSAMSEVIEIDGESFTVVGIIADTPRNTHYPFKYVVADHLDLDGVYYWTGGWGITYAKLGNNVLLEDARSELEKLYTKYAGPEIISFTGHDSFEEFKAENPGRAHAYVPHTLKSIHLDVPNLSFAHPGSRDNIQIFFFISVFILLIACINYINMSTARSTLRSKEVGIRKTLGSYKNSIILQFLTESMLITFFAILFGFGLAILSLDLFNSITLRAFNYQDLLTLNNLVICISLLLVVGVLAGAYPAFIISGFNPVSALKGGIKLKGKSHFRNGLVSFQFATSVFLIAATLVIYLQVDHLLSQDLGIDINKTLIIRNGERLDTKYDAFKRQLLSSPHVKEVAKASHVPFMQYPDFGYHVPDVDKHIGADNFFVEAGFERILDMQLKEGRFFKPNTLSDTSKVIINEALAKEVGWENPIGKKLVREPYVYEVVGVVSDFNYRSLKRGINSMIFRYAASVDDIGIWHQRNILVKYTGNDIKGMLEDSEEVWNAFMPDYPFDSRFLDDAFDRLYDGERRFGKVFTTFSLLAIFIAFLGLFSLTTFILQRRFKEIAVRKVMGATVSSLLKMMMKEFTWLVIIGGVIGISGAFYWLNEWLNDYSYRITLEWYLLVFPVLAILSLTWIIVSIRSYSAATANPSNALKEE